MRDGVCFAEACETSYELIDVSKLNDEINQDMEKIFNNVQAELQDYLNNEIGEFDEEDFVKSGISLEEYTNPNEDTIKKLVEYVANEYDQTSIYSE